MSYSALDYMMQEALATKQAKGSISSGKNSKILKYSCSVKNVPDDWTLRPISVNTFKL